jgi:transcriptional regulator with XRE-family HTH domain
MEAKRLAMLTNIDAANLSRIEQGRYSVGLDILTKIAHALGVKVDLV